VKRFLAVLTIVFAASMPFWPEKVWIYSEGASAQEEKVNPEPKAKKAPFKRGRGRIAPKNLQALRALARLRHPNLIRNLPNATAASYDSRTLGIVPPIEDQGQCGSCWDFSGTEVVEVALIKAGYGKADGSFALSQQYTLDCGQNGGCGGDDNTTVLAWAKSTGLPLVKDYGPYTASAGKCAYTSSMPLYKISDWGFVDTQTGVSSTQLVKNTIVQFGIVGCAVAAGNDWDNVGPNDTITGTSTGIDHDVAIVGWDDAHDNGDKSKGAWIMRNSWGTSWGGAGYAWIKYGADSIGTESVWATATPSTTIPQIGSPLVATGATGSPFSYQIVASNSPTSYGATNLPSGLTVDVAAGAIAGTPATAGTFSITISATNAAGTGSAVLSLTVSGTPPPPVPPPGPTPSGATITLSAPLAAGTYQVVPAGSIVINGEMTLTELMKALEQASKTHKKRAQAEPRKADARKVSVTPSVEKAILRVMSAYDEAGGRRDLRVGR
jgi:C1A family cysteine protease